MELEDSKYAAAYQKEIERRFVPGGSRFIRTQTLGTGGSLCDFNLERGN